MQVGVEIEPILVFGGVRAGPAGDEGVVVTTSEVDELGFGVVAFAGVAPGVIVKGREIDTKGCVAVGFLG
jgi:hypothetical protein